MRKPAPLLALVTLTALLSVPVPCLGAEKTPLSLIETAEKYLTGRRRSSSKAMKYFQSARKKLTVTAQTEHLDLRLRLGLSRAYEMRKKYKEGLAELSNVAREFGDKAVPKKAYGSGETRVWAETLMGAKVLIASGKASAKLVAELQLLAKAAAAHRTHHYYAKVAEYLCARCYEEMKKYRQALPFFRPILEYRLNQLAAAADRMAKADANRTKTPSKIPAADEPPGKLEGKYKVAVFLGLDWLKRHQAPDGTWDEDGLAARCDKAAPCPQGRSKTYATAQSHMLAIQAFVRAGVGYDHAQYGTCLKKAVDKLLASQTPAGLLARKKNDCVVEHSLAMIALAEVALHVQPKDERIEPAIQKAVKFLAAARTKPYGWHHGMQGGSNSQHTAYALLALSYAKAAGVEFEGATYDGAMAWIDKMTDEVYGRTGFVQKGGQGVAMAGSHRFKSVESITARALAARLLWGAKAEESMVRRGFDVLWSDKPAWKEEKTIHFVYWVAYSLAYALKTGKDANFVLKKVADLVIEHQDAEGCAKGAWPAMGAYSFQGRVAATARALLAILNARRVRLPAPQDATTLPREKEEGK